MKAIVGTFNHEKALVGAFSMIVKIDCETDVSFYSTTQDTALGRVEHSWGRVERGPGQWSVVPRWVGRGHGADTHLSGDYHSRGQE